LDSKAPDAFRTIGEVADELDLPQHVLRFWESRFRDIRPMKRGGGRRYYRPEDIELLRGIKYLLYGEGYTIRGVQRILREQSVGFVQAVWREGAVQPPHGAGDEEEFPEEAVESEDDAGEEPRGLRGRLSSLIGRDLGDRGEDADGRHEPPLKAAPVPRIDPADRTGHVAPEQTRLEPARPAPSAQFASAPAPGAAISATTDRQSLPRESLRKLQAVLHELAECRKLLDNAVARPE
jgi:DNA-binding transcriptional MerR regulator